MSLVVWLPLTKDLRQQGLSNVTVTNNGVTYSSTGGKLGGCYNFTTTSWQRITFPYSLANKSKFSVCLWIKIPGTTITGFPFGFCHSGDYWQFITYNNAVGIRDNASGLTGTRKDYSLGSFVANQWTHLAFTYNAGTLKTYKDGVLFSTNSTGGTAMNDYTIAGSGLGEPITNSSNYYFNGSINDFRVYDHCLSPMEIKELAKGLVLHYPLNRNGFGCENLVTGTSNILRSGSIGQYYTSLGHNSTTFFGLSAGDIVTFRIYLKAPIAKKVRARIQFYNSDSDRPNLYGNYINAGEEGYSTITWTLTATQRAYSQMQLLCDCNDGTTTTDTFYWKELKLEKSSVATPWCPNSSDTLATTMGLNSTTEYDCSGFGNNGTRTGTFTWTSDTPKYAVSQYFNGSSYILTNSGTFSWFNFDKCTVAVWMKPTTTPSSWAGTFGIAHNNSSSNKSFVVGNYGGKFTMQSANGNWVNVQASNLPINEWHHCVATLDGTTIKMYFDGELVNTYTINWGNTTVASDTRVQVGNDLPGSDEIYVGYYSDARIYATALSADDVKSLYQNSAYIDSSGNVYGAVHSEV